MALQKVSSGFDTRIGNTPTSTIVWDAICGTSVTNYDTALNVVLAVYAESTSSHGNQTFPQTALYYRLDGGTWTLVTGATAVAMAANGALTDNDAVGNSAGCQTTAGSEEWTTATGGSFNFTYTGIGEAQFGLDISGVAGGVLIEFSLDDGAVVLDASITTVAGVTSYETFLPSALRVLVTQETSLPSTLRVLVTQQTSLPSALRVNATLETSLPTSLRVLATQQISLPSNLKVRVIGQQLSLPSALRVILTSQLFLPSSLRVNATQQLFLSTNLKIRGIESTFLPTTLRVVVSNLVFLPTTLRVNATLETFLPTILKVRVEGQQISLPTSLRVVVSYQEFLPTSLRVIGSQETSLPTNLKVRGTESTSLPSQLKVAVQTEIFLPTNLRVIGSQQSSLPTNMRVKTLANQLVMPSSLRVLVVSQISVPTSLRVKVIGNLLNIPTNLRIKVVGQQLFLPTTLRIFLQYQISLPSSLAVRVSGLQLSLPSQLRVILFTGNQISLPTTMRVKAVGQQLVMSSNLRVEVPPLFTISIDDTDVGIVRKLLAQAGREVIRVHEDDILPVFYSGSDSHLYTDFQDIMDVQHIRLVDDINHSGTNYLQGSTIYDKEGKIEIGLTLPANTSEILITYATRDGLDDEAIQLNIDMAKFYLQGELWRETLDFSGSSTYEQMAKWTLYSVATYWSILGMNSSNAIQSGYNYRIAEFEIQTKLWGEGMIAETLLNKYWERSMQMINALKLFESNPEPPLYVVDRTNTKTAYNKDPTIFHTMTSMEAVRIYDSVSRYAVIMKIYG